MLEKKINIVLLSFIPLLLLMGGGYLFFDQGHSYVSALTEQQLKEYARLAVIEEEIFIEQTRHLMSVVAGLPQVTGTNAKECNSLLAGVMGDRSRYANASVVKLDGTVWCSGLPLTAPLSATASTFFNEAVMSDEFSVGEYAIGNITKTPVLPFAYPVQDSTGKTKAILFFAINISWLQRFVNDAKLPVGSTLTLIDDDGHTLARYPDVGNTGAEAPEVSYSLDEIKSLESELGEIQAHDAKNNAYYVVAVPIKRESQEGYLHLIISVPKASFVVADVGYLGNILLNSSER